MSIEQIRTDPDPYEPFRLSQAMRVGELLFVSGQAAISPEGELVGIGDFDAQAEQTFRNLERVLEAGGSGLDRVVKVTIFLTDVDDRPLINPLRQEAFGSARPASTLVEVSRLVLPEAKVEIECVALVP